MTKTELRADFAKRAKYFFEKTTASELERLHGLLSEMLSRYLQEQLSRGMQRPQCIAIYKPLRYELPIKSIAERAEHLSHAEFAYPEYDEESMWFVREKSHERCTPDFVFVPGLFVDKAGNRLGRGKGYYDRYFTAAPLAIEKRLFLGYPFQMLAAVPHDAQDVKVAFLPWSG